MPLPLIYEGYTGIPANANLDALWASIAGVQPPVYNASMGWFNVRDTTFGALGNGTHDDTAAFIAAIAAAALVSGTVYVPVGTYKITAQLTWAAGVTMQGDGAASILNAVGMDHLVLIKGLSITNATISGITITGTFGRAVIFTSCSTISLTNIRVSGGTTLYSDGTLGGFQFHACTDVDVAFNVFSGNGLTGSPGSDIVINGLGLGISHHIRIHHNKLSSTAVWFNILGFDCAYVDVHDNWVSGATGTITYNNGYGIALYRTVTLPIGQMRNNSVARNWVSNTTGSGIYMQTSTKSDVTGNHLWDVCTVADDSTLPNSGIALNGSQGVTVRGNHILRPGMAGITISMPELVGVGTVASVAGVTTFSLTQTGAYTSAALTNLDTVIVGGVPYQMNAFNGTTGCHLMGDPTFGASAFTWASSGDIVVSGNEIEDAPLRQAIKLGGPLSNVTVTDNDAKNCWGGIGNVTSAYPCSNIIISKNRITSTTANYGILGLNCFNSHFDDNTVLSAALHGMEISGGGDSNTANGNIVRDASQATPNTWDAIHLDTTNSMVDGNVVRNTSTTTGSRYGLDIGGAGTRVGLYVSSGHRTAPTLISQAASGVSFSQSLVLAGNSTAGTQLQFADSAGAAAMGTRFSGGDYFMTSNATQALTGADLWTQTVPGDASLMFVMRHNGNWEFYRAAAGTAAATFATFWGAVLHTIDVNGQVSIGANIVVKARGAAVADVASANATDLPTVILVANECKQELNLLLARVRAATGHGLIA